MTVAAHILRLHFQRMRLRQCLLLALGLALAGAGVWFAAATREPSYQGKPLSWWIAALKSNGGGIFTGDEPINMQPEECRTAIRKMGPLALPGLLNATRRQDTWWEQQYRSIWSNLPVALRQKLPSIPPVLAPVELNFQWFAADLCQAAAPDSLPLLFRALRNRRPEVRETAVTALGSLSARQFSRSGQLMLADHQREVIAGLAGAANDRDFRVRGSAILALGQYGPAASNAVPQIVDAMLHLIGSTPWDSFIFRPGDAADALRRIGPAAASAVPALRLTAAQQTNSYLRIQSARALWRIHGEVADVLPVLLAEFDARNTARTDWFIDIFRDMGSNAKAAAPLLVAFINAKETPADGPDLGEHNRQMAVEALERIAPDEARRLKPKAAPSRP